MTTPQPGGASGTPADPATPPSGQVPTASPTTNATTPTAPAGQASASDPNGTPPTSGMTLEQALDALGKVRAEAAKNRVDSKRLADLEAAMKAADDAKLSEQEKLQRQLSSANEQIAQLQVEQQSYRLAREIAKVAPSLNLIDPDAAMLMLQASGEIEYDDEGHPKNVAKLLEKLVADKPYLVATNVRTPPPPPSSGGATNPGRGAIVAAQGQPAKADPKDLYKNRRGLASPDLWKR